ncbi:MULTISPECIES: hypothetical protein [Bacillus]|uniref:Uncharacterized protein n=2 Tax=Bacillus cereus TaxID=1396 RepID=J8DI15_BACCE|nr:MULTISPECIES: hypothetical protein [Bacillus]EJQ79052.1 hypothetical protein IGC_02581 [Bacillus cereus HuA4-10]EOO18560.1 hypothetical protein IGA_02209 [Bacillus cereus HuA3-9]MBK5432405.1 hypothetical protein [Bacillus sp. TH25]
MDYELFEELKPYIENAVEDKKNSKEVIKTLANLITHVAEFYIDDAK